MESQRYCNYSKNKFSNEVKYVIPSFFIHNLGGESYTNHLEVISKTPKDNYSKEELSFYDFSFFLEWKGEEKDTVITGNKHHNLEAITWVKS